MHAVAERLHGIQQCSLDTWSYVLCAGRRQTDLDLSPGLVHSFSCAGIGMTLPEVSYVDDCSAKITERGYGPTVELVDFFNDLIPNCVTDILTFP